MEFSTSATTWIVCGPRGTLSRWRIVREINGDMRSCCRWNPTAVRYDWPVGFTPIVDSPRLAQHLGIRQILLKDEGRNPTGSFKDRSSAVGVSHALQVGAKTIACASTGNAASSLAGHAALAGLPAYIFVPHTAPEPKVAQLQVFGATVFAVNSSYDDAYDLCTKVCQEFGWYNRNCAINPVLVEGKKTAGLEIAEQSADFGGVPDWVAVSVGDGCTIAGIWKGLCTMRELGVIDRLPRLLGVQAAEVKPIDYALQHGELPKDEHGTTIADSIDVHVPRNWHKAVRAIHESERRDPDAPATRRFWMRCGWPVATACSPSRPPRPRSPESSQRSNRELSAPHERVLAMITGSGLKDTRSAIRAGGRPIPIEPNVAAVSSNEALTETQTQRTQSRKAT